MDAVAPLTLEPLHVIYNMPEMVETSPIMHFSVIRQESLLTETVNVYILDTREKRNKQTENSCRKVAYLECRMNLAHGLQG